MTRARSAAPQRDPKTGTWFFVVDIPSGGDGKRRQVRRRGFPTKNAADQELQRVRGAAVDGSFVTPTKLRLADYFDAWLDGLGTAGLRTSTISSYRRNLRLHVTPRIGGIYLQALTPLHLDALYAELLRSGRQEGKRDGLAPRTVRYVHTIVGKALADAMKKGLITRNPATAATAPSAKSTRAPEMKFWTPAELQQFLSSVATDDYFALYRLAAMTGMRRGEVCGLHWSDVNLEAGTVQVKWQLTVDNEDGSGRRMRLSEHPKTDAGRRTIDIDPATVSALRSFKAKQSAWKLAMGEGWTDTGLVFTRADGAMLHPERVADWFAWRVGRVADLPRLRFHDLRHTHCALLIAAGQEPKLISRRLGHASVSFTLDRYGHLMPESGSSAASAVSALVDGPVVTNL